MPVIARMSAREIGVNSPNLETGTLCAFSNSPKSERTFNAKPSFSTWGGARNRADRASNCVTLAQASRVILAAQRAYGIGLPLNRHVTLQWTRAGIEDFEAATATGAFLTLVRDWLRKRDGQFAYTWVRENDEGDGSKGSHVHILMHLPASTEWTYWRSRRWLERVTGRLMRVRPEMAAPFLAN